MSKPRWILAFDASCGRCRQISEVAARVGGGRLRVLPLTDPDVIRWRTRGFGENPPWVPTLLRVDSAGEVRAWTGPSMAVPLVRLLGVGSVIELLRGLGSLSRAEPADGAGAGAGVGPGRRGGFGLLPVGVLAVLAGWLMATAQTSPGGGDGGDGDDAHRWVQENLNRLPQDYEGIAAHPITYRRAIYARLSPEVRSQLWSEQLLRYAADHPGLTPSQGQVLDTAMALAGDTANFAPGAPVDADQARTFQQEADAAFGREEAARLFAVLGAGAATEEATPAARGCTCATRHDWCGNSTHCDNSAPCEGTKGCGMLWWFDCDGLCVN